MMLAKGVVGPGVSREECLRNGMSEEAWIYYTNNGNRVTIGDLLTKIGAQTICKNGTASVEGEKGCGTRMRADVAMGRLQLVLCNDFEYWDMNLRTSYLTPESCEEHLRAMGTEEGVELLAECKYCCTGVEEVSAVNLALDVTGNLSEATKFVLKERELVGMEWNLKELVDEWEQRREENEK